MPVKNLVASGAQLRNLSRVPQGEAVPAQPERTLLPARQIANSQSLENPMMPAPAEALTREPAPLEQPPNAGGGGGMEREFADAIMRQAVNAARTPEFTPLPEYQPLEANQRGGFKARLMGGLRGLLLAGQMGRGDGRGGGADLSTALGLALRGAINPEALHQTEFQMRDLAQGVAQRQREMQQYAQGLQLADRQGQLLSRAASAVRALRDPQDIYKQASGAEAVTLYNPRTGQYEIAHDDKGQPIEAATVATTRERAQSQEKIATGRNQTQREIAAGRNQTQEKIAAGRNQTQRDIAGQNNLTRRTVAELNREAQMERVRQTQEAQDRRTTAGMMAREGRGVSEVELKQFRAAHPDISLSDDEIRLALSGSNALPNARKASEWLQNQSWKSVGKGDGR